MASSKQRPTLHRQPISYYMLGGKMVGERRANQTSGGNGQYRLVGDHLGGTTLLVDTTASPGPLVVQRQYYSPYGQIGWQYNSAGSLTDVGFTGQRLDADSGLMFYGARFYDPALSYFVSADTVADAPGSSLSWNRYLYAHGNPVRFTDPSGHTINDHYVFVFGCVSHLGSNAHDCDDQAPNRAFGDYETTLHTLFNQWIAHYAYDSPPTWAEWRAEHVHMVASGDIMAGANKLTDTLMMIEGTGSIHLWGHSAGAASILQYLASARNAQEGFGLYHMNIIDSRIASVAMIDGPMNDVDYGLFMSDKGLMGFLEQNTRVRAGSVLQVENPNSFVHSRCVSEVDCRTEDYAHATQPINHPNNVPTGFPNNAADSNRTDYHTYSSLAMYGTGIADFFWRAWR